MDKPVQWEKDWKWACHSPWLWCSESTPPTWLEALRYSSLQAPPSIKGLGSGFPIGRYFEKLVAAGLEQLPGVARLTANLSVLRNDGQTKGEMDLAFVFEGVAYHVELAVKLYLLHTDTDDRWWWYGPRGRDFLRRKVSSFREKQLPLSRSKEGIEALGRCGIVAPISNALIRGYLFYPFQGSAGTLRSALASLSDRHEANLPGMNSGHLRGLWLHRADWLRVLCNDPEGDSLVGVVLQKPHWLARKWLPEAKALRELEQEEALGAAGPQLVALVDGAGFESQRIFIVPDKWPELQR